MIDGHQVCLALRTTYLSMHRKADAVLFPLGVTANQFVVLAALAEEDGISQKTLVQRIASDPNTIRPILSALEEKGLVSREASSNDGRVWEVKLTRKGRTAFTKISGKLTNFHETILTSLTKNEAETLIVLLGKVAEAVSGAGNNGAGNNNAGNNGAGNNGAVNPASSKSAKRKKPAPALAGRK